MARGLTFHVALIAMTLAVYGQVITFDFVSWDDPEFVTANLHVRSGLTAEGLVWAFTSHHGGNWHPLTGMSHMLDCQLYGLNPAGHHVTSVLLHVLNTLVLFAVLRSMTHALWPSALVAALFAVHPLHVESVAWVSERKDVLSTLWGFLAIGAYVAYVRHGNLGRYFMTAGLMGLSLMAKPMLVTLPLVFLLVDYWPLGRVRMDHTDDRSGRQVKAGPSADARGVQPRSVGFLVVEKLPLLALSAISSVATFIVQRGAGAGQATAEVSFDLRVANALVSYVRYMGKTVWPNHLSALYPHPSLPWGTPWEGWQVAAASILLLAISALVLASRRRYAIVGWLWYLGTLVPVIGLVQVGEQAMADRYTYVPLVGLFTVIAWGAADVLARVPRRSVVVRGAMGLVVMALLGGFSMRAWSQAGYWRDSLSLYRNVLENSAGSPVIYNNLGHVLRLQGELEQAIRHYRVALDLKPDYTDAHTNLGIALQDQGKHQEAISHYREVLRVKPGSPIAHNNLGYALQHQGKLDEAIGHYRQALTIQPEDATTQKNLGDALQAQGDLEGAVRHYRNAVDLKPEYADARTSLAVVLQTQGKLEEAISHHRKVLQVDPHLAKGHSNLGAALQAQGKLDEAISHYREALRIQPDYALAHRNLGVALLSQGKVEEARSHLRAAGL